MKDDDALAALSSGANQFDYVRLDTQQIARAGPFRPFIFAILTDDASGDRYFQRQEAS